jgi:hypothetical protein
VVVQIKFRLDWESLANGGLADVSESLVCSGLWRHLWTVSTTTNPPICTAVFVVDALFGRWNYIRNGDEEDADRPTSASYGIPVASSGGALGGAAGAGH